MTQTPIDNTKTVADGGSLELLRVPAWQAKYKLSSNPEELAHMVCCRDLDWRRAICGYYEEHQSIVDHAHNVCTMCVETAESMGVTIGDRQCPIEQRACPDDEEVDKIIAEHTSRS